MGLVNAEQVEDDDEKADCAQSLVKSEDGRIGSLSHGTRASLDGRHTAPYRTPLRVPSR